MPTKKFAVLMHHQPGNGRSYYVAKDATTMTCKTDKVWTTEDRNLAFDRAVKEGGTVVDMTGWAR